jgi:hypothetical protein
MVVIDAVVYSEQDKVIKCRFKPGSVGRTVNLDKAGIPRQRQYRSTAATNEIRVFSQ